MLFVLSESSRSMYTRPQYWQKDVWDLNGNSSTNNGYENEDLIVWMRTAALPTFRKLHRIVDRNSHPTFSTGLPKGQYIVEVNYSILCSQENTVPHSSTFELCV